MPHTTIKANNVQPGKECYVLFPKGDGASMSWTLPSGWLAKETHDATFWYAANYGTGLVIPTSQTSGTFNVGSHPTYGTLSVTVVHSGSHRPTRYIERATDTSIRSYLSRGYNIELGPGRHYIYNEIPVPHNARIQGNNSTLIRKNSADTKNRIFVPSGNIFIDGITFDVDKDILINNYPNNEFNVWYLHTATSPFSGYAEITNCTIRHGSMLGVGSGSVIEDCVFEKGGGLSAPNNSIIRGNKFIGHTLPGFHSCSFGSNSGCLVSSNHFINTNRGLVIQNGGAIWSCFLENYFEGINGGENNSSEVILLEAFTPLGPDSGIRDNAFIGMYIHQCVGAGIELYGGGIHDNIFSYGEIYTETPSIYIYSNFPSYRIGKNDFSQLFCKGPLYVSGPATGISLTSIQFIDGTRCNPRQDAGDITNIVTSLSGFPITTGTASATTGIYTFSNVRLLASDRSVQNINSITFRPTYTG